jgi:hypothetical protein
MYKSWQHTCRNYDSWLRILQYQVNCRLSKIDIHNYSYIIGPHIIEKVHWVAVIIDIFQKKFQIIDPQGYNAELSNK